MRCANCGAELKEGTAFCTSCGRPVEAATERIGQPAGFCMNCGAALGADMAFCMNCGSPAGVAADTSGLDVATVPAPAPTQAPTAAHAAGAPYSVQAVSAPAPYAGSAPLAPGHAALAKKSKAPLIVGIVAALVLVGVGAFAASQLGLFGFGAAQSPQDPSASQSAEAGQGDAAMQSAEAAQAEASSQDASPADASSSPASEPSSAAVEGSDDTSPGDSGAPAASPITSPLANSGSSASADSASSAESSSNASSAASSVAASSLAGLSEADAKEHRYEFVSGQYTWTEAKKEAESRGGHLVTVLSDEEWDKVLDVLPGETVAVVWAGGYLEDGKFSWVTGEDAGYTRWAPGEPNNDEGKEDKLCLLKVNGNWGWYDTPNNVNEYYGADRMGMVVEYDQ